MVDAAIGGKTGVNLDSGKNLVGAFHLPLETIVDIHQLRTLSRRDVAAGLAEVIKCGMIADPKILELAEQSSLDEIVAGRNEEVIQSLIARAIAVKQSFVAKDLRESGVRAFLNYGHTLGHAIEVAEDFSLRHGEAVALGMIFAAELSRRILGLDADAVQRQRSLLEQFELPTETINTDFSTIFSIMKRDKKVLGDRMRFVLLRSIGEPELNGAIDEEILESVYQELFVKA
jgi:3-dehydroquinate synthase